MPPIPPERAALERVPGSGPVRLTPVARGLVNDTWRVERDGRRYSLRRSRTDAAELGIDRDWECRVLGRAADAGLAPRVVHCAPADGVLIAEWAGGDPWTAAEALAPAGTGAMAALLRRVHALAVPDAPRTMDPGAWLDRYGAAARRRRWPAGRPSAALQAAAGLRLDRLAALAAPAPVLCHGDLHRLNLSAGATPQLLDWEFAHVAESSWDVAGWVCNNDGSEAFAREFLEAYLGRRASAVELHRLDLLRWLYDYVCLVWCELCLNGLPAGGGRADADGELAGRARVLSGRLAAASADAPGGRAGRVPAD